MPQLASLDWWCHTDYIVNPLDSCEIVCLTPHLAVGQACGQVVHIPCHAGLLRIVILLALLAGVSDEVHRIRCSPQGKSNPTF